MATSVAVFMSQAAKVFGTKTALVFENRPYSFYELDARSSSLAHRLETLGLRRGDRISLYAPNSPDWIITYYAILKMGAVVNPLNMMLTPVEAAYAINDCSARAVIGTAERIAALTDTAVTATLEFRIAFGGVGPGGAIGLNDLPVGELPAGGYTPAEIGPDDPCAVCYTSGTTGHPKGAILTHGAITANTSMTATMHMRTSLDTVVSALPCSHVYGNIVMNSAIAYGMTLILHQTFEPATALDSIQRYGATIFEGVPTMYMYLMNFPDLDKYDLSSLTRCTVGGQTMPLVKILQVEEVFNCPLIELWGMTEIGGLGTTHTVLGPRKTGSIGIALPHVSARIASQTVPEVALPSGEVGELQIRGPIVMAGYIGNPEATAETFSADGWLRTGDLAYADEDGFLYVVDRLKDLIITAGFNIYPAELERVIAACDGVAMVAVGSVPDADKGELAKAYIVPNHDVTLDIADIERHCREHLAAYKVPRAFQIVDDFPKTSTGKVLRRKLHTLDQK